MSQNQATTPPIEADAPSQKSAPISKWELVFIISGMMALNALAIDIMLPALPQMQAAFGFEDNNQRQLVVVWYVMGLGISQVFYGPLIDRFGRKPVLRVAVGMYVLAGIACAITPTYGALLFARAIQGAAAGATRVVIQAVVRDFYSGRAMAEIMSLAMMIFMAAPILAPGIGQLVMLVFGGWKVVFWSLVVYGAVVGGWTLLRLPETMSNGERPAFNPKEIMHSYKSVLSVREFTGYSLASAFVFASLFSYIASSEQLFHEVFHTGDMFPLWFAGVAACMAVSNFTNSRLVRQLGMRRLSHAALIGMLAVNALHALIAPTEMYSFGVFYVLMMGSFLCLGFIGSNFSAIAMEPMQKLTGTASAIYGTLTTFLAGFLGAIVAGGYNGNASPIFLGNTICLACAFGLVLFTERGKLFHSGQDEN